MTITEAARALASGRMSARGLLEESLAAVGQHNARTNAFVRVDRDGAWAAAEESDRRRARGESRGPLDGIPISLKDLIDVAGEVTSAGSRVLADRIASDDAPVVTRLRDAGAVRFGRTNLHEFALGTTSEDSAFGPVRHPLDATRVAGGSSGGSAVAVATGMGLASIGTDTGGSIRIPAAACGVVGLKASRGEVPTEGVIPLSTTLDHVGPLTSSVEDAGLLWAILAGRPVEPIQAARPEAVRLRRLTGYFDAWVSTEIREAVDAAIEAIRGAGVQVGDTEIDSVEATADAYISIVLAEAAEWHAPLLDTKRDLYSPIVADRISSGRTIPAVQYIAARHARRRLQCVVDAALAGCDALVLPTLPIVAPPVGAATVPAGPGGIDVPVRAAMLRHTQLFNMTGHPAISLPVPSRGLPAGLQLAGRARDTAGLLAIASVCEKIMRTGS